MKNIVDTTIELLSKKDDLVTIKEIIEALDNEKLTGVADNKLEAYIHMDLMKDGRFLLVEDKWGLAQNYTQQEITRERYRQLGNQVIEEIEDEVIEEEIARVIELDENYLDDDLVQINFDDFDNAKVSFTDEN
jgi:hypothetical protein